MNEASKDVQSASAMNEEAEGYDLGYSWASNEATYEQVHRALLLSSEDFEHEELTFGRGLHLWRIVHGEHADYAPRSVEDLAVRLVGEEMPSAALMRGFIAGVHMADTNDDVNE